MNVTGIIAEYNPFHNGHRYHIEQAKAQTKADYIVVIMSGNFTQRGIPACLDKFTRTKMALQNGADLVLELPVCYAASSAETFAEGSVSILHQTGIINTLCFGAEAVSDNTFSENISALPAEQFLQTAAFFTKESPEYQQALKQYLKAGHSFPLARSLAAAPFLPENAGYLIASPNNVLGLEYCKAILKKQSSIRPVPITRKGAGYHDTTLPAEEFASASAIRKELLSGVPTGQPFSDRLAAAVPENVAALFASAPLLYMTEEDFYPLLYYRLLYEAIEPDYFLDFPKELADRLKKAPLPHSYEELVDYLKTKQYTRTRIERALLHVLLQITTAEFERFRKNETGYARILGFRKEASPLLRALQNNSSIPVITRLADAKKQLADDQYALLSHDIRAARLYQAQVYQKYRVLLPEEYAYLVIT